MIKIDDKTIGVEKVIPIYIKSLKEERERLVARIAEIDSNLSEASALGIKDATTLINIITPK